MQLQSPAKESLYHFYKPCLQSYILFLVVIVAEALFIRFITVAHKLYLVPVSPLLEYAVTERT